MYKKYIKNVKNEKIFIKKIYNKNDHSYQPADA